MPRFAGETSGHSFAQLPAAMTSLVGVPIALMLAAASLATLTTPLGRAQAHHRGLVVIVVAILLPYLIVLLSIPRLEPRFLLPILPVWMLLLPLLWRYLPARWLWVLMAPVLTYNLVAGIAVGQRFLADPRTLALDWVAEQVPAQSRFESSAYSPRWNLLPEQRLRNRRMPFVSARYRLLSPLTTGNPSRQRALRRFTGNDSTAMFSLRRLARTPIDYVAINSIYDDRFTNPPGSALYPEMQRFFTDLRSPPAGYRIVFDAKSPEPSPWLYPGPLFYLDNRMTILAREHAPAGSRRVQRAPRSALFDQIGRKSWPARLVGSRSAYSRTGS